MTLNQDHIDRLFGNRLTLTMEETSGILGIEVKGLRQLANTGKISFLVIGSGTRRPRRRFTREHVLEFLRSPPTAVLREAGTTEAARIREAVRKRLAADGR